MRTRSTVTAGLIFMLGMTPSAEAQFGSITKKAQDAVTKQARPDTLCAPKFDHDVIELTPNMLTRVVAGMRASRRVVGRGGMTPQEMVRRAAKATEEHAALLEGRDDDVARHQQRVHTHTNCMNDALETARQETSDRMGELIMTSGASDPQLMQDIQRLTMKQHERLAAGDTAGAREAQAELARRLGGDPKADTAKAKADTAKATAKCGRVPAKPAWLARADSLNEESYTLLQEARAVAQRADTVGAQAAGLDVRQFAVAVERVEPYVVYVRSDGKAGTLWCYSPSERTALDARMAELKELVD